MKQSKYLEDGGAKFKIKQITKVYEARRTNIKPQDYLYKINFSNMNQDLPSKFLLRKNHKTRYTSDFDIDQTHPYECLN
jgi:hypothetical protein